jgi:hypothetical protein
MALGGKENKKNYRERKSMEPNLMRSILNAPFTALFTDCSDRLSSFAISW